jgi:hypothetical protein
MDSQLTAIETFYTSLPDFDDDDGAAAVLQKLITRVMSDPYRAETIGDSTFRVVRGGTPGSDYPPLRLFYTVTDDGVITLHWLESDGS